MTNRLTILVKSQLNVIRAFYTWCMAWPRMGLGPLARSHNINQLAHNQLHGYIYEVAYTHNARSHTPRMRGRIYLECEVMLVPIARSHHLLQFKNTEPSLYNSSNFTFVKWFYFNSFFLIKSKRISNSKSWSKTHFTTQFGLIWFLTENHNS